MTGRRGRGTAPWLWGLAAVAAVMVAIAIIDLGEDRNGDGAAGAGGLVAVSARRSVTDTSRRGRGSAARPISLQWVGDIALSSELGLPPGGVVGALSPLAPTLRDADVTLGNLEGTLSIGGQSKCGADPDSGACFAFQAPPAEAFGLKHLGFDLVNQANNHAEDFGPAGHAQTTAALRHAELRWTGDPGQVTYLTTHRVRVAFLGFAPYSSTANLLDIPAAQALVRAADRHAALVVVIIHAGAEGADETHTPRGPESFLGENRGDARAFAHAMIRAGASVVFGSGPHVIRGVQRYRGHLIAYSLGNFVGYHTLGGGGVLDDSGILRVALNPAAGTLTAARWIPVTLQSGLPRRATGNGDVGLIAALSREDFPHSHLTIHPDGRFAIGP